jgi:hypothetical protein
MVEQLFWPQSSWLSRAWAMSMSLQVAVDFVSAEGLEATLSHRERLRQLELAQKRPMQVNID